MSAAPVVLVHGAWTRGWAWGGVRAELEKRGVASVAPDMPSAGSTPATMRDDVAAIRAVLERCSRPAVLVGHSYAGITITEASAGNDAVAHLIYVCAAMPEHGQSTSALMREDPVPSRIGEAILSGPDGLSWLSREGAREFLYNDVPPERSAMAIAALGTHRLSTFAEAPSGLGWREHPSTYVVTTEDRVFSPDLQRRMARNAGTVIEIRAGHAPLLSRAAELADAIAEAAHAAD